MSFEVDYGLWGGIFAVPNAVADIYVKRASELQLKVLLLALRSAPAPADAAGFAARLGCSEAQVGDALDFWREAGLFREGQRPAAPAAAAPAAQPAPPSEVVQTAGGQKVITTRSRSKLTPSQVNTLMDSDPMLQELIGELQKLLGNIHSPAQSEAIAYMYSAWSLSPDYILMVARYYADKGHNKLPYIEKRIAEWLERGIDNHEKAEAEIKRLDRQSENESVIRSMFGLGERTLSKNERAYIERWFGEFQSPPELIRLAYDKAADNTGKISFPYVNKVLADWHKKGITTPEAAEAEHNPNSKNKQKGGSIYNSDELQRLIEMNTGG